MTKTVPLLDAALELGMTYASVRDAVLTHRLKGGRDSITRRWFVNSKDLKRFIAERKENGR